MAESVGKIYGTAFFELSDENGTLEKSFEELEAVRSLMYDKGNEDTRDLVKLLCSPLVSGKDKTSVLEGVFGGRISGMTLDLLCLIAEKGRFGSFESICEEFREMYNQRMNILEVTAITAMPLNERLEKKLVAKLESVSGKKIVLTKKIDKSIIGGIVIKYENSQIDSSVKSRLDKLRAQVSGVIA